jgi:hypothetical protein
VSSQFLSNLRSFWHELVWSEIVGDKYQQDFCWRTSRLLGEHRRLWEDNTETAVKRIDCEDRRRMELTRDLVAGVVLTMLIYSWNMNVQIYLVRPSLQTPFQARSQSREKRPPCHVCLSVRPSLDGLSSNFVWGGFTKICRDRNTSSDIIEQKWGAPYPNVYVHCDCCS